MNIASALISSIHKGVYIVCMVEKVASDELYFIQHTIEFGIMFSAIDLDRVDIDCDNYIRPQSPSDDDTFVEISSELNCIASNLP